MGCKINSNPLLLWTIPTKQQRPRPTIISFSSASTDTLTTSKLYSVKFKTLSACNLGIARYPDFEYDAEGGTGIGSGTTQSSNSRGEEVSVSFDIDTLYIPPLQTSTTKFLGLPLPPFLKISIVPEMFRGIINQESGKVELEFKAKFWFSVGSIYIAPPLVVETILTSEESIGAMRSGKGERLDQQGNCKLVGVATVEPIDDWFLNTFLGLPTECLAGMNAVISLSPSET